MGDAYRGLTIRIGVDTSPVQRGLRNLATASKQVEASFRKASKALKLNPTNAKLQAENIRLLEERASVAAAKLSRLNAATDQASASTKKMAASTKNSALAVQEAKNAYTSVNASLQAFYDSWARATQGADASNAKIRKASKEIKNITRDFEKGKKSATEFYAALARGTMKKGFENPFGIEAENVTAFTHAYKNALVELRAEHKKTLAEFERMKEVDGFKQAEKDAMLLREEIRQVAAESIKARAEMRRMGSEGSGLRAAYVEAKALSGALTAIDERLAMANSAIGMDPGNIAAIAMKFEALSEKEEITKRKLKELERQMREFSVSSSDIQKINARFGSTANAVEKAENKLADAKAKVKELTLDYNRLMESAKNAGKSGSTDFANQFQELKRVERELAIAEGRVRTLTVEYDRMNDAHTAREMAAEHAMLNAELAKTQGLMNNVSKRSMESLGMSIRNLGYGLYSTITMASMMVGMYAVQAAKDVDSAYRDMRKTVNGTESQFVALRQAALEFSQTHFTSADTMLEIEAIGGQLGIAAENLGKFGETVSSIDIATNLDTETISENLGQLSNIMNDMDQSLQSGPGSFEAYGDALVRLGNNSAAQEDKIQNVMMRIASMGTISGMTTPDLLALATATAATGQGAEAAGTALSKTFSGIEGAVNGSQAALEKLKDSSDLTEDEIEDLQESVEKGQDKLQAFADVAGMSAEEFSAAWNGDRPMEAFRAFIAGLKRIDEEGGSVDSTLNKLKITSVRQKQTLQGLVQTLGVLDDSLTMSNDAWNGISDVWGEAGDAAREAQRKSEGFSGQLQILANNGKVMASALGDAATPAIKNLAGLTKGLADGFEAMPGPIKESAIGLLGLGAVSGPAGVLIGTLTQYTAKLGGEKGAFAKVAEAAKRTNGSFVSTAATMKANLGVFGTAGAKMRDYASGLEKANGGATRLSSTVAKLGNAVGGLTLGKFLGIGTAVIAAISLVSWGIDEYQKAQQKKDMLDLAAESMTNRLSKAYEESATSIDKLSDSYVDSKQATTDYNEYLEKCAQAHEQLAKGAENTYTNIGTLEYYTKQLVPLMEKLDSGAYMTDSDFASLNSNLDGYNKITGRNITATKDEAGNIRLVGIEAGKAAEEINKLTEAKKRSMLADMYGKENESAVEERSGAMRNLVAQQKVFQQAAEEYEKLKAKQEELQKSGDVFAASLMNSQITEAYNRMMDAAGNVEYLNGRLVELDTTIAVTSQLEAALNSEEANKVGTIQNLVANNEMLQASFRDSNVGVLDFAGALDTLGVSASQIDADSLVSFMRTWKGDTASLIGYLEGLVGEIDTTKQELLLLNGIEMVDKDFRVDDHGTVSYQGKQVASLNGELDKTFMYNGQECHIEIDVENGTAAIKNADNEVQLLAEDITGIPSAPNIEITTNSEQVKSDIQGICDKYYKADIHVNYVTDNAPPAGMATGGYFTNTHFQMHANGGYFVDKPTVIGRDGNVTHIAGEAGKEYVMKYASGGVVLPLTDPNMRPWVDAVSLQTAKYLGQPSNVTNISVTLDYKAGDDANKIARDLINIISAQIG